MGLALTNFDAGARLTLYGGDEKIISIILNIRTKNLKISNDHSY